MRRGNNTPGRSRREAGFPVPSVGKANRRGDLPGRLRAFVRRSRAVSLASVILLFSGPAVWAQFAPPAPASGAGSSPLPQATINTSSDSSSANSAGSASSNQNQNQFLQSVPSGQPVPGVLKLSLLDAIDRGLKQNLGLLISDNSTADARGARWQQLSNLLPSITGQVTENLRQIDLAAEGFTFFPGVPVVIGPFGYVDARAYYSQSLIDLHNINNLRSANQNIQAAKYSYKDARELVVLAVGLNYLQVIMQSARIETVSAQLDTAQALYKQAHDQFSAGTAPAIDQLRAQVEFQTRQQELVAARNDLEKQKLALARVIGLPLAQQFELTDKVPYREFVPSTIEDELQRAYAQRSDYQSAQAKVHAAEFALKAAHSEYLPSVIFNADYGDIGTTFTHSHGTVDVTGALQIPIFNGGKTHGDVIRAEAALKQNRQELENLRAQIDQDVRSALLDVQSYAQQVQVAQSNIDLSNQALKQARDRFSAGVTNNIEVVQAQESVASANESYITSLFNYDYAKLSLARAVGFAEQGVKQYMKGQ